MLNAPKPRMLRAIGAIGVTLAALSCGGDTRPAAPAAARSAATSTQTISGACYRLGLGSAQAICDRVGRRIWSTRVETAIDWLVQNRPQLFDKTDVAAPSTDLYRSSTPRATWTESHRCCG